MAERQSNLTTGIVAVCPPPPPPLRASPARQWKRRRPYSETARMGAAAQLAKYGPGIYSAMGKRSAAARRARGAVRQRWEVKTMLNAEERALLQETTARLGVGQGELIRSCLVAGLEALREPL